MADSINLQAEIDSSRLVKVLKESLPKRVVDDSPIFRCYKYLEGVLDNKREVGADEYYELIKTALNSEGFVHNTRELLIETFAVSYIKNSGLDGFGRRLEQMFYMDYPLAKRLASSDIPS